MNILINKHIPAIFYTLTAFVLITALYTACTLQPGGGSSSGNTSSTGGSLSSTGTLSVIYVATNGSDSNSGTNTNECFRSIQTAIDNAADGAAIYIAAGVYTNGSGLNNQKYGVFINKNNLRILGGWNEGFTAREPGKYSELDGNKRLYHIIYITNSTNVVVDGFVIRNGYANQSSFGYNSLNNDDYGAGILMYSCIYCTITNSLFSNNVAYNGGGLYLGGKGWPGYYGWENDIVDCDFIANSVSNGSGGGLYYIGSYGSISGTFTGNTGSGIIIESGSYNSINGVISGNSGNGIALYDQCSYNSINGTVSANSNRGISISYNSWYNTINGAINNNRYGIEISRSSHNEINAAVISNQAGILIWDKSACNVINGPVCWNSNDINEGGGICISSSDSNIISASCVVRNNTSLAGGGIYIGSSSFNVINGLICGNSAVYGGGICASGTYAISNIINGIVNLNTASNGGGIYISGSFLYNTISGSICSNSASDGGGIYINRLSRWNIITNAKLVFNQSDHGIICMSSNNSWNQFINNTIGGQGTGYGFYEEDTDASNTIMLNNIFLTNTMNYLYHDFTDGDTGLTEIDVLNTANDIRHDASTAGGNIVSNKME